MKNIFLIFLVMVQFLFVQTACSGQDGIDYSNLWMSKTIGTWKIGKDYGYYRALVIRAPGKDASQDDVYVQIIKRGENGNTVERTIKLNSPGYKGYVEDIKLVNVDDLNQVAVHIDIEMKAMNDLILSDVFLVSPEGKVKALVEAKYIDIYPEDK